MRPCSPLRISAPILALAAAAAASVVVVSACATRPAAAPATAGPAAPGAAVAFPGADTPVALPSAIAFVSLEGPLWIGAQRALYFSDVVEANGPGARIYRYDVGTRTATPLPYPAPGSTSTNGLAIDPGGRLIACERYNARVIRIEATGAATVLADRWPAGPGGKPLGAPNDVTVRADGNVYFTDSDWGARPGVDHAAMGVYRVAPDGTVTRILDLQKPNGIALAPDGSRLYVGSDVQAKLWSLPLDASGTPGAAALFVDGHQVSGGFKVPDGICVDDAGNLYVTNNDDAVKAIVVFDPAGRTLGRIALPFRPSNCTFGGDDRRTMYVTTLHAIYEIRVPTPGLP